MFTRTTSRRFCSTTPQLTFFNRPVSEGAMYFLKGLQLVGVIYCVKTYGMDFNTTWGASMSPLIREDGNIVIVDKLTPRFTGYRKGDVVVAAVPTDGHLVMKRICGTEGESVSGRKACRFEGPCGALRQGDRPFQG